MSRPAWPAVSLALALALMGGAAAAQAQPVATAQGREGELSTAQQIAAWTQEDDSPPPARPLRATPAGAPGVVGVTGVGPGVGPGLGADSPWAEGLAPALAFIPFDAPPIARTLADGRIHGEVGAEVGNRGYGGYATASGPLGPNGAVQVSVSDFQGTGGGRWRGWNGDHKSLGVSAVFDFSRDRKTDTPVSAAPATPPY